MTFLLADDHAVVREGLKLILQKEFPGCLVGQAKNCRETLAQAGARQWDIVVLDVSMPDRSGIEILRELKLKTRARILILSVHPESQLAARCLRAGADGYVSKDCSSSEFLAAVRSLSAGKKFVSAHFAETVAEGLAERSGQLPHEQLSDREFLTMRALGAGRTVTQIAKDMSLSVKTVSTYRRRILEKLGVQSVAELVRYLIDNKLL